MKTKKQAHSTADADADAVAVGTGKRTPPTGGSSTAPPEKGARPSKPWRLSPELEAMAAIEKLMEPLTVTGISYMRDWMITMAAIEKLTDPLDERSGDIVATWFNAKFGKPSGTPDGADF